MGESFKAEYQSSPPTSATTARTLLSERPRGRLHRIVRLPKNLDPESPQTCLQDGVLLLTFSKLPESHNLRRIELT